MNNIHPTAIIGPNAVLLESRDPRQMTSLPCPPKIGEAALVGANAVIMPGIEIGHHATVGAGAIVTKSVPPYAIAVGNPARIIGYTNDIRRQTSKSSKSISPAPIRTSVKGVRIVNLKVVRDLRGDLMVGEFGSQIPFAPARFFTVFNVPNGKLRGEHAHKECHQFLVCISGSCSVVVDDGAVREEFQLDSPETGIYMPPLTWGTQYKYSLNAILAVFASHPYDQSDYLRSYDDFIRYIDKEANG